MSADCALAVTLRWTSWTVCIWRCSGISCTTNARVVKALRQMSGSPGVGVHLMRAGLREHRALMDRAVCAEDWILAESILHQVAFLTHILFPSPQT